MKMDGLRLLFVDDEPTVLRGLKRLLHARASEWQVRFSSSGEEALRYLEEQEFDVLVTDMRMPGMDGAKLLEVVQERHPGVARVVLSGHAELEAALRALPVAHQFLSKPCPAAQLRGVLERAAAIHALVRDPTLQRLVGGLTALPARPRVFFELNRVLLDERSGAREVAQVIETDVGISTKVLQLVNTAFFGAATPIKAVDAAVARLGVNVVKSVVLSAEVSRAFYVPPQHASLVDAVTEDSLHVARVSASIARLLAADGTGALVADAFMAGMLHQVGWLVLAAKAPARLKQLQLARPDADLDEDDLERQCIGATLPEIGAYLLGLWGLPYCIAEAVSFHRHPEALVGQGVTPASIVVLARALMQEARSAEHGEPLEQVAASLGLTLDLTALRAVSDKALAAA